VHKPGGIYGCINPEGIYGCVNPEGMYGQIIPRRKMKYREHASNEVWVHKPMEGNIWCIHTNMWCVKTNEIRVVYRWA
jgi:hypothetical protein